MPGRPLQAKPFLASRCTRSAACTTSVRKPGLAAYLPGPAFQEWFRAVFRQRLRAGGHLPASFPSNRPGCFSNTHPEHPRTFLAARKTQLAKIQVTCHSSRKDRLCTNQRPATDPTRTGDICGAIIILLYCLSIQPTLRQGLPYGPPRGIRAALPFPQTRAWHPGYDNAP